MSAAPKVMPQPHPIQNVLAFRTPQGGVNIHVGQTEILGTVETSEFANIRLVADERAGSTCDVILRLSIMEGNEVVGLLDEVILRPHTQLTQAINVPATKLQISISGFGLTSTKAAVDVLIYGQY